MSSKDAPSDPAWDDLPPEKKHELLALAETLNEDPSKVKRRDVLAGAGALGAGALLGGGASYAATEPASAGHGGGQVGTSSDPVDVNAASVTADELSGVYDHIVTSSDDLDSVISTDLSANEAVWVGPGTHTVDADGLATLPSNTRVHIPSGATIKWADGIEPTATIFSFNNESDITIILDGTIDLNRSNITAPSSHIDGGAASFTDATNVEIRGNGTVTSPVYRCFHGYRADNCDVKGLRLEDAGANDTAIEWDHGCVDSTAQRIVAEGSGSNTAYRIDGTEDAAKNCEFVDCVADNWTTGFTAPGEAQFDNKFVRCTTYDCGKAFDAPRNGKMVNCTAVRPTSNPAIEDAKGAELVGTVVIADGGGEAIRVDDDSVVRGGAIYGGGARVKVYADDATVNGVTAYSAWAPVVEIDSTASGIQVVNCREIHNSNSTTLDNGASAGDTTIDLASMVFHVGQYIDITLDDGSTHNTYITDVEMDAQNGSTNTVSIADAIPSGNSAASGNSVADAATPGGITDAGTDSLIDGNYTVGGVDTSSATNPTTGTNV